MSPQKQLVEKYIEGFNATDHEKILSCLTADVIWDMPGYFYHEGIEAFDKEIENPNADGDPIITITRMIEEDNIVIAEGAVKAKMKDGSLLDALFCDVLHFRDGKICKLTTYIMFPKKP
jgi:ketosteroid isomerase-like protein